MEHFDDLESIQLSYHDTLSYANKVRQKSSDRQTPQAYAKHTQTSNNKAVIAAVCAVAAIIAAIFIFRGIGGGLKGSINE